MRLGERRSFERYRPDGHNVGRQDDLTLSELLRRFAQDAGALVRQEIALAKLELHQTVKGYTSEAAKIGVAVGVGFLGVFGLTAFAIVGLGDLINNYWLAALIVGGALLAVAALLA